MQNEEAQRQEIGSSEECERCFGRISIRMIGAAKPARHRYSDTHVEMTDATLREMVRGLILRVNVCAGNVSIVLNPSAIASQTGLPLNHASKELRVRLSAEDRIDANGETLVLTIPV